MGQIHTWGRLGHPLGPLLGTGSGNHAAISFILNNNRAKTVAIQLPYVHMYIATARVTSVMGNVGLQPISSTGLWEQLARSSLVEAW